METTKEIKNYNYTTESGMQVSIRTEKYGVCGFSILVSVEKLGLKDVLGFLEQRNGNWIIDLGCVNKRRYIVQPIPEVINAIRADKAKKTPERVAYDKAEAERKRKEREYDDMWNDGGEGYNPYRRENYRNIDNTPYYKED